MARIENHKYSIEDAFRECFYIVPDYQREYVWTEKEVHQLLDDITDQIDTTTQQEYFVGMVLVSPVAGQKNHFEVIDGQQGERDNKPVPQFLPQSNMYWLTATCLYKATIRRKMRQCLSTRLRLLPRRRTEHLCGWIRKIKVKIAR